MTPFSDLFSLHPCLLWSFNFHGYKFFIIMNWLQIYNFVLWPATGNNINLLEIRCQAMSIALIGSSYWLISRPPCNNYLYIKETSNTDATYLDSKTRLLIHPADGDNCTVPSSIQFSPPIKHSFIHQYLLLSPSTSIPMLAVFVVVNILVSETQTVNFGQQAVTSSKDLVH